MSTHDLDPTQAPPSDAFGAGPGHVSTLALHQLRYGELDADAAQQVRAHLGACDVCAGRLRAQERERAAFVLRPMPDAIRAQAFSSGSRPASSPRQERPSSLRDLLGFAVAVLAAASLFVLVPALRGPDVEVASAQDTVRVRGELPLIEVWVDTGAGPRLLRDSEALGEGHRVQIAYDPQGASYVALAGRDGSGQIEVYTTDAPTGVGLVRAPFALTLDDAPGVQELFVIGAGVPLDARSVRSAVTTGLPGIHVARVAIRKQDGSR